MRKPVWPGDAATQQVEVIQRVNAALQDRRSVALLRFVAVGGEHSGLWHPVFGRVDICRDGDMALGPTYAYRDVRVLSQRVPRRSFRRILRAVLAGTESLVCAGTALAPFGPAQSWAAEEHSPHGRSRYATWPCLCMARALDGAPAAHRAHELLASSSGAPYFGDLWELIGEVATFHPFHGASDTRKHALNVLVWNHAGRIARVAADDRALHVHLEGDELEALQLSGRILGAEDVQQIRSAANKEVVIESISEPRHVDLALVASDHQVVDRFTAPWVMPPGDRQVGQKSLEDLVDRYLREGEWAQVEYKRIARLDGGGDRKWVEILQTAIAMANAEGGVVLIGIDDHGMPTFGPEEYKILSTTSGMKLHPGLSAADLRSKIDLALDRYGRMLRDRLQKHCNKSMKISLDVVWRELAAVLVMYVSEGDDKPYIDDFDNSIWFRANATNRRATEAQLASIFAKRERR